MKYNRKREPLQFGTVFKTLFLCGCAAAVGLGYVALKNQVYRIGSEVKKREDTLTAVQKRNVMLAAQLGIYKSPSYLEGRCRQYKLELAAPKESQMVRLLEPGPEWDAKFNQPASATGNMPVQPNLQKKPAKPAAKVVAHR